MALWDLFVDLVSATLFALAPLVGDSLGGAIVMLSVLVRLALLPLTLRLARRSRVESAKLQQLAKEMKELSARHAREPEVYMRELERVHERLGYRPRREFGTVAGKLIELPILAALYTAISRGLGAGVRFLWIGNLARPDLILVAVVMAMALAGAAFTMTGPGMPTPVNRGGFFAMLLSLMLIVGLVLSRLSAGLVLYWAASNAVGLLQTIILRRDEVRGAPAA